MKITKQSVDLPEERYRTLAVFMGWKEKIMTETESPNYEIDNPQSFSDYIIEKDSEFMIDILKRFNMQEAEGLARKKQEEAKSILEQAEIEAKQIAKGLFEVTVEN